MSESQNEDNRSLVKSNSKLIIVSKGRITSAKDHINYITLQEGEHKLTMQVSNSSLNKNDINRAVNNMRSQKIKNANSYTNLIENSKDNNKTKILKEKKFYKIINKEKENIKKNQQTTNIETTKNNNFMETSDKNSNRNNKDNNNKDNNNINDKKEEMKIADKIKLNKLNIVIPTGGNEDNDDIKSLENDDNDNIEDLIINENLDSNSKKNENNNNYIRNDALKIKISDIINTNITNRTEENKEINNFEDNQLGSKEAIIEEKNQMKKKLSSQEMSMNNNEFEELKKMYIDSSRSKENTIPLNNNLSGKNNHLTKLSKKNVINKSENISDNNNFSPNDGVIGSAIVTLGDNIKSNYMAQNLITEMEGDEISNKNLDKDKEDLISDDNKTIKIDENPDEDKTEEKEKIKENIKENIEKNKNNNLEEKKVNEVIKIHNSDNIYNINNLKESNLTLNNKKKNEKSKEKENEENIMKSLKYRSLNFVNIQQTPTVYNICQLCEHTQPVTKLFVAECKQHFFCKKCAKIYYEEIIENGIREMVCPLVKCRKPVKLEKLDNIISDEHFKILTNNLSKNNKYLLFTKLKTETLPESFEIYTEKHVLDIDSNKKFYNFNNRKEAYCPYCNKDTLFTKGNMHYGKCLNCQIKICKHCSKEFKNDHLDLSSPNHCKVFYRTKEAMQDKKNICLRYLLELFFVIASFYLTFAGAFLLIREMFSSAFNLKDNKNCIKYAFLYLFTFICFLIAIPIIFIFFPVFPSLMATFYY